MKRRININVKNQDKGVDTQNLEEKVDKTLIHNTCDDSKCGCVNYDKYREDFLTALTRKEDKAPKRALGPIEKPFLDKAEDRQASRQAVSQEDHNAPKEAREARMAVNKEVSMGDNEIVPGENWEDLKKQISNSKKAAETLGILKTKDDSCHDTLKDVVEMTQKSPYSKETVTDYEYVNHPKHYNNYDMEVIDMMVKLFGAHETISFCKLNAFKYRMRAGTKPGETAEKDIQKEQWYLRKAEELESYLF
jgi:hypothetical protein